MSGKVEIVDDCCRIEDLPRDTPLEELRICYLIKDWFTREISAGEESEKAENKFLRQIVFSRAMITQNGQNLEIRKINRSGATEWMIDGKEIRVVKFLNYIRRA